MNYIKLANLYICSLDIVAIYTKDGRTLIDVARGSYTATFSTDASPEKVMELIRKQSTDIYGDEKK